MRGGNLCIRDKNKMTGHNKSCYDTCCDNDKKEDNKSYCLNQCGI